MMVVVDGNVQILLLSLDATIVLPPFQVRVSPYLNTIFEGIVIVVRSDVSHFFEHGSPTRGAFERVVD